MSTVPVTLVAGWIDADAEASLLGVRMASATGGALLHTGMAEPCASGGVEAVAVDEEVAYRSPGCPCCAVRLDLVDHLGLLARRHRPPGLAVVVGSPGSDAATSVVTLLEDPLLRRRCRLDGVVTCVSGRALAAAVTSGVDPWPSPSLLDAVLLADVVWIADAAALTVAGIRQAAWAVRSVNPAAAIDATTAPDVSRMVGLRSWALESAASHVERVERSRHPACPAAVPTGSSLLRTDRPLDPDLLDGFLDELHGTTGARLLRLDGVVQLASDDRRHLVQGCRTSLRARAGSRWRAGEHRASRIRIVARGVDVDHLVGTFEACAA